MFSLENQIAIVTGGANGIGKGIVEALAEGGAKVIVCDIDAINGEKTAVEFAGEFYHLDVTDRAGVQAMVDDIVDRFGKIDILVSNTGIFPQAMIEDMTEADWDHMFDVNVKSMFHITQATFKHMKAAGYGRVVVTSSVTGPITGYPGWAHYGASKASQLGYVRSAAMEYAKYGVTVNGVQPGNILTDGLADQGDEYLEGATAFIPMKKLGEPTDIGYAVAFLASKEAKYITGQSLVVDGGQILPEEPAGVL